MSQMGFDTASAVIAPAGSLSAPCALGAGRVRGIIVPAGWLAAALTFQVSIDGTNYFELIDDRTGFYSASTGFAVAAGQYLAIDPVLFDGVALIKVRSGTLASPVVQTGGATLTVALRIV